MEYPACITKELETLDKSRSYVLSLVPHAELIELIAAENKGKWPAHYEWGENIVTNIGVGIMCLNGALLNIYTKDFSVVLPILRELRRRGYKVKSFFDYEEMGRRTYDLGDIKVSVFLPTGDTAPDAKCRMVKVGTKEVDVLKMQCDGADVTAEESKELGVV